jgi:hypothetical protein
MDNVLINIAETPNEVTANVTSELIEVTINVTEGAGLSCADLAACQTIIDIVNDLDAHESNTNNPHATTLQKTITESNEVNDGVILQSKPDGFYKVELDEDAVGMTIGAPAFGNTINFDVTSTNINSGTIVNINGPSVAKNGYEIATENFVDNRVQSNIKIIGDWDATSGSYPLDDESNTTPFITQWGATIKAGWAFRVGYGQAGTVDGFDYENGDVVYALIDNPTDNSSDWGDLDHNLQQANESLRGTAKIVTAVIIADETSTDDERIVTTKKLWLNFWTRVLAIAHTFAAKITFTTAPRFSSVTASEYLKVDANKDLISVNTIPMSDIGITTLHAAGQTTTSNAATPITGLSFAAAANTLYSIDGVIATACSATGGLKFNITLPAGATMFIRSFGAGTGSSTTTWNEFTVSGALMPNINNAQASNGMTNFKGEIQIGAAAGNIVFGYASGQNTQTSTIRSLGTYIRITKES